MCRAITIMHIVLYDNFILCIHRQVADDVALSVSATNTIPNDYRQHSESGTCNQLQITQYEYMQGSSSLSWVRASFVRQLTEAFIIPLRSLELTKQIGEGMLSIVVHVFTAWLRFYDLI